MNKIVVEVEELFKDLTPQYLENRRNELPKLQAALQNGDFSLIETAGHQMKGNARSYGFSQLTDIGRELELAAQAKDSNEISILLEQIQDYLARVVVKIT